MIAHHHSRHVNTHTTEGPFLMVFHKRLFASISLLEGQMFVYERVFGVIPLVDNTKALQ